ncbi:hypothetical protein [Haloarcula amylolytica]|uniref:hypothetical protein n=1 Tax=Haloarcula amylolytica TaxID=396317 RepID=UPI003C711D8F
MVNGNLNASSLRKIKSYNHGLFLLFLAISLQVVQFVSNIGNVSFGTGVDAMSGLPIAVVGVWLTFTLGLVFNRSRKRYDTMDKVGLGLFSVLQILIYLITPVSDFVLGNPVIGLIAMIPFAATYFLTVIR